MKRSSIEVPGSRTQPAERGGATLPRRGVTGAATSASLADEKLLALAYRDPDAVLGELATTRDGLTEEEVEARRERFGRNEVAHEKPPTWYAELARSFANPFNFLLTTLAIV